MTLDTLSKSHSGSKILFLALFVILNQISALPGVPFGSHGSPTSFIFKYRRTGSGSWRSYKKSNGDETMKVPNIYDLENFFVDLSPKITASEIRLYPVIQSHAGTGI